jgi:signal transduction histidine kinase
MPDSRLSSWLMLMLGALCVVLPVSGSAAASAPSPLVISERSSESPVQIQGAITFVDASRKLMVVQRGEAVVALHTDLISQGLAVGDEVELEGRVGPLIPACPGFPDSPDGSQIRDMFEAPPDWAEQFLSRLRGVLHPPATGNYTFWIASDDSSELWLSDSTDPVGARRIALVPGGRWTEPHQWTRIASQQSATVRLEAGKAYYIEALGQDTSSRDSLAVAWRGPGIARTVIEGKYVTPWSTGGQGAAQTQTNGVRWEYWSNFYSSDFSVLKAADENVLKLTQAQILKRKAGKLPEPVVIRAGQSLDSRANFRWLELEANVQFVSRADGEWLMDLGRGRSRITARIRGEPKPDFILPINSQVRVAGFFEPTRSLEQEERSGTLWVTRNEAVMWLDTPENWSLIDELPQRSLTAANAELPVGRTVRLQGRVIGQEGNDLWRLQGKDTIQGYVSADGTNWSIAGPAIELNLNHAVQVGFAISSHRTGEVAVAEFADVEGLPAAFSVTDIGNPQLPGGLDDLGGSFRVRGNGDDIWHQADQCCFAYQTMEGDFQVRVRLAELHAADAGAKAVLMVRESLSRDSPWGGVVVMPGYRVGVQGRQEIGSGAVGTLAALSQSEKWLKLVRQRNTFLVRARPGLLKSDQMLDVLGEIGWQGQGIVLERSQVRELPVARDPLSSTPPPESASGEVRNLPIQQIEAETKSAQRFGRQLNVRIRGVVTFNDQVGDEWFSFVQDPTSGIRIQWRARSMRPGLEVGDWVEVTGSPTLVESGVELLAHGVTRIGSGAMPDPLRLQLEATKASTPVGQWIELEGVGRTSAINDRLLIASRLGEFEIFTGGTPPSHLTHWVNSLVRVRGVMWRRGNPILLLPSGRHIEIIEASPEDPFGIPVFPVQTLQAMSGDLRLVRRLKVSGVITCQRDNWMVVQDKTGGIRVESTDFSRVKIGDEIEVVGFPRESGIGVILSDSLLRTAGQGKIPSPTELESDDLVRAENNGRLVSIEAVLLAQHPGGDMQTLDAQSGQRAFQASLPAGEGKLPLIAVGSRLRLMGVTVVDGAATPLDGAGERGLMGSLELLLRSPHDVVVVERPPWWNWKHTAATVGLVVVVFAGAVIWIRMLRKRVEERTYELRETMGRLQRETQISATLAERDRLAAEIHDSVEQGLSAIMMQMEAATMVDDLHEVKRYLDVARNMAGFSRSEVQHAVWDLQSPLLENADLITALRRVAHDISAGDTPRVTFEVSGNVFPLPSAVEHHLLRIAQEAITNAVKHGAPKTISLTLQYTAETMTLSVRDDGGGFVPEAASSHAGHFGLQGMHTRAGKIHAELLVMSKPGEGTCIQITVSREVRVALDEPVQAAAH